MPKLRRHGTAKGGNLPPIPSHQANLRLGGRATILKRPNAFSGPRMLSCFKVISFNHFHTGPMGAQLLVGMGPT